MLLASASSMFHRAKDGKTILKETKQPLVLVIEDNRTTSEMLVLFLAASGYRTQSVESGRVGAAMAIDQPYDLVLLDLMLPDLDGFQVCRLIRERSEVPIIMLTARRAEEDIVRGLECGADDYVYKPFSSKVLLARVAACLRRKVTYRVWKDVLAIRDLVIDIPRRSVFVEGDIVKLTRSEFDILRTLAEQPGRVFTRDQLISAALGSGYRGMDRIIDTHIWSLRKKLAEPRGKPRYILSEPGVGYRFNDA